MPSRLRKILKWIAKVVAWIVGVVVLLLIAVALLIRLPAIQDRITQKAVSFLEETIGTKVTLGNILIGFPKSIVLRDLYMEDQRGDTLIYVGRLSVNTDLWALTNNRIELNNVALENTVANVYRTEGDSAFNFSYIPEAFANDSTPADTVGQKEWTITLEALQLENIRLRFDDNLSGNFANLDLGELEIDMDEFDLSNNTFAVDQIALKNTHMDIVHTKLPSADEGPGEESDSTAALTISARNILFENVGVSYDQRAQGQQLKLMLGELQVLADKVDMENKEIALNRVALRNSTFEVKMPPDTANARENSDQASPTGESANWQISLGQLELSRNTIEISANDQPSTPGVIDFNNLLATDLTADVRDLRYTGQEAHIDLRDLSFQERSGFAVRTLKGMVDITAKEAVLNNLILETGNSAFKLNATASYPSLSNLGEDWQRTNITAAITDTHINTRDIYYLNPAFADSLPVELPPRTNVYLDSKIEGIISDLELQQFTVRSLADTRLDATGRIAGLPNAGDLQLDLSLDKFRTTRADLRAVLPESLMPDSVRLPEWIELAATYTGSLEKARFTTHLTSDVGEIEGNGNIDLDSASSSRGVNADLVIHDFHVGGILGKPDSVIGSLALDAGINIRGLAPDEMEGTLKATIGHFDFQGYRYENLRIDGTIRDQVASLQARLDDENLDFDIDANYAFKDEIPRYDLTVDLRNADFNALHLSTEPIRARGTLAVDLATADFKVVNGNVDIRKVAVYNGEELYAVDSLLFASIDQEGRSEINIESDLLSAQFAGSINIFGLPSVMREFAHSYYALHDSLDIEDAPPQNFRFAIQLKNTDLLTELLVPELTTFEPGPITGEFNSEARSLDISMEVAAVQYGSIGIQSFSFTTESDPRRLNYRLAIDKILFDSMRIDGLEFAGVVANNEIETELIILDSADQEKYVIAGTLLSTEEGFDLRLPPDRTVLNYETWTVPADNYLRFGGPQLIARNLELAHGNERIAVNASGETGTPITINFRNLNLEDLISMIAEERPASGLLEGDINLLSSESGMTFTSDLSVSDFKIRDVAWGDIALHVEQEQADRFDVNVALRGSPNEVTIEGYYSAGEAPSMDITATVVHFDLPSLQPLLQTQVRDLKGRLQGEVRATGSPQQPRINGELTLNAVSFFSHFLNTAFSIDDETISLRNTGIEFDRFEVKDQAGNIARLDGSILTRDYLDYRFRLDLTADNFRMLDTEEGSNDLFYGRIDIQAKARIRGNTTTPVIDLDVSLADGSNITYIVPQSEAAALETEGIVKFVDRSFDGDPFMQQVTADMADTVKTTFRGIDLTARIELTDQEQFSVIIDPITRDQLTVSGNSTLTLQIDPSGDMNLTGRLEISKGTYNLSFYKFVKREFQIEKGSSITWLGDPLNAQMDIRAIFNVETAPIELLASQSVTTEQSNQYKQRLPFMVYLLLNGELLQPEISFRLDMPMDQRNALGGHVYARLQDINTRESDLNKQVFALLILKRFISDNPFENRAGGGFESTARSSVSKILSDQLNRLSENIKGVELSFDVKSYEDYTSGQAEGQTELQLGVSKSLLNDRLVVKLSGNIDIEGENANRDATDYIGDLAIEYKITQDGRFRITGFRNSNYDMIDGELIETGTGLIYVKDYNSLSELFKSNTQKNK